MTSRQGIGAAGARRLAGVLVAVGALALAGCAPAPTAEQSATATQAGDDAYCARMVTNSGGLEDRSFNQSSWEGLEKAQQELGIDAQVLVSTGENDLAPNVDQAVQSGCGFVLTVGYELAQATLDAATASPDTHFAIVDETVDAPNVKPIVFDTAQAAYLAGYLAAGVTKTGKVATFGGGNQPPVTLFMDGFSDGVDRYNADHGTSVQLLGWSKAAQDGVFTGDFEDINKGKTVTQSFIDQGADVILPVAGQVGEGAASAALDSGDVLIVWVDNDGYDTLPAEYRPIILTSVMKNTGDAVVSIVGDDEDGSFDNTPYVGTLANGGVGLAPYHSLEPEVSADLDAELKDLEKQIVAGTIVVQSPSTP
ncbi:BMP family ABC transporter substrate-binding protein [Humibacter sp. BT305]|uniref:BMP family ABC transporter substrate-binding protein n=1 Tax=Cnuibacter physcomitrellae TaxID=1619308 RepID=A0A1X9LQ28_9MICO|nr:BMP family ABC transporter substrate-binding protein [Cnuibacter physcomitrellae]ARJ06041.1 BMP family ABC transporter substrate-binding protein [Cnuibacter physcomitrellae]AXH35310.1 BMP family ABC transporter substrate-binding protein [Humibacter sp. BT305]MCS5496198.1 BMP family ABC transporter substrate-binding protein [Cnuibacter physcomitrellae]GGI37084.1 BMP family ABC transporter substrate-binding protein [Cnuibacter physcomitrellae]